MKLFKSLKNKWKIGWKIGLNTYRAVRKAQIGTKFGDPTLDDHYRCISCGLSHKRVEAGGIWACPNIACTVSGNAYFRSQLKSFKEEDGDKHSIDIQEWEVKVTGLLPTITDKAIYAATENSLWRLRGRILINK